MTESLRKTTILVADLPYIDTKLNPITTLLKDFLRELRKGRAKGAESGTDTPPFDSQSKGTASGSRRGPVIMLIRQYAPRVAFRIVVLAGSECPEERGKPQASQKQRYRNQNDQNVQWLTSAAAR